MKRTVIAFVCLLLTVAGALAKDLEPLRKGFVSPPAGGKTQTWWHWTSPIITKEGITADLESMKAIGYEGLHLFTTNSGPGWMEMVKYSAEEMQRLGLTFGFHNCPGWSLSGGPWITPENSMQMIVSSEVNVSASSGKKIVLPQPETRYDYYRDIAVLAFPDVNRHDKPRVITDFREENTDNILDRDNTTFIRLPISKPDSKASITVAYDQPYSPQFVELTFGELHLFVKGTIEASSDGVTYREAGEFDYKIRTDMKLPKCIRLNKNAENARFFKVTFMYRPYRWWMIPADVQLNEMRLLASSMVTDVDTRNSTKEDAYSYKPFDPDYVTPGIDPARILDLSDKLRPDGALQWDVPDGNWTVLRIGHTTTGKQNGPSNLVGLECDKLNRRGLDAHWPEMPGKIIDLLRHTGVLKYAIVDSYEAGGQNWTEGFADEFSRRRGYALKPYLPAVIGFVVGTPGESARFLYDFQRTIAELMAENYYDYFTELCHQNGLLSITESYFGPFDYLRCARNADVPTGEFWVGSGTRISRMPGSAAHFHGLRHVMAEAFTTTPQDGRWQQDPKQMKAYGDHSWIQGVSQLVSHSFVHQPFLNVRPGMTLGANGSHLNRANTWWNSGGDWVAYMNRSQYLLQAGLPVADMLVLSGESDPNQYPNDEHFLSSGYNYDFCCVDDLYDFVRVRDGRIAAPSGVTYRVFSLGSDKYLTLKTLRKVYELLEDGAAVSGVRPAGSPSLSDTSDEYNAMVEKIWGNAAPGTMRTVGKGVLVNTADHPEVMRLLSVAPDVTLTDDGVEALHRRDGETDIYFVYNNTDHYVSQEAGFRVSADKVPKFWYADNARMEPAAVWRREGEHTIVRMDFVPRESWFVVFRPGKAEHLLQMDMPKPGDTPKVSAKVVDDKVRLFFSEPASAAIMHVDGKTKTITAQPGAPIDLSDRWSVNFPPDLGAPESVELDKLISLNEHSDAGVRYFSGTAVYKRSFSVPGKQNKSKRRVVLSLGNVRNLAEVKINGKKVALLWKDPFAADITDYLRSGENTLEIAVTNLWVNRLIGDARNPAAVPETDGWPDWVLADRPNSGAGHYTYTPWKGWAADEELLPSGLIGPVALKFVEVR